MNQKDHVVFGAFLHDIGKLYERAELLSDYAKDDLKLQEYCPKNNKGCYSQKHALYTLAFCEKLQNCIPTLKHKYTQTAEQNWVNMAVRYHKPSSVLEHIVSKASRLASGEREETSEKNIHKKTLLEPLLEKVSLKGEKKSTKYRIPLKPLNTEFTSMFPKKYDQLGLNEETLLSPEKLITDYHDLAKGLLKAVENFSNTSDKEPGNLRAIFLTLLSQFERFLIHVPSATHVKSPDISLFDHLRITAAIAEGFFIHHENNGTLQKNTVDILNNKKEEKWSLLCGDFSGIQKFIYSIISKGAAKGLAGRSIYVQLFCDAVSEWLLKELDLYPTSRIYSSGGKFYILTARCLTSKMEKKIEQINTKLFKEYKGKIHLDYGVSHLCGEDFNSEKMDDKFKEVNDSLLKTRKRRFYHLIKNTNEKFFEPENCSNKVCSVCGSDEHPEANPSVQKHSHKGKTVARQEGQPGNYECRQCKKFIDIGTVFRQLVQRDTTGEPSGILSENGEKPDPSTVLPSGILWVWNQKDYDEIEQTLSDKDKKLNFFNLPPLPFKDNPEGCVKFCIIHNQDDLRELKNVNITDSHFEFVNCIAETLSVKGLSSGYRFMAACDELNLDTMIDTVESIKRLGILRMDVDNLGEIFIKGLHYKTEGEQEALSRKAALSRQLNAFFTGYLPQWAKKDFAECKIVYAGGDDLLVIGPWHKVPDMAFQIKQKFEEFCCWNPDLTLSAGVSLITPKYPVLSGVLKAGEAEEKAKSFDRSQVFSKMDNTPHFKNAFCFFGTVIGWEEYTVCKYIKDLIENLISGTKSKNLLQVLYHIDQEIKQTKELNKSSMDIYYQPWRYRFVYYIARLLERQKNNSIHVKQKDNTQNNITNPSEGEINTKTTFENTDIKSMIHSLKSIVLMGSQGATFSELKLHQMEGPSCEALKEDNSSSGFSDRKFHRHPVHWLYMPVRWVDYLQREKNNEHEGKKAA